MRTFNENHKTLNMSNKIDFLTIFVKNITFVMFRASRALFDIF